MRFFCLKFLITSCQYSALGWGISRQSSSCRTYFDLNQLRYKVIHLDYHSIPLGDTERLMIIHLKLF